MGVTVGQKVKGKGKPWWVFVAHDGQRISKKVCTKDAANEVAKQLEARLALCEDVFAEEKKADPTFGEYAKTWIETMVPATCKTNTIKDYEDILRIHVKPVFENFKIKDIKRGMVKDFLLSKVNEEYARSTVSHMKNVVSGVLNKAVDDDAIPANPAHRLGKPFKNGTAKKDMDPFTKEELKLLLDTVRVKYPRHYTLFLTLARTGMRIGEALAFVKAYLMPAY